MIGDVLLSDHLGVDLDIEIILPSDSPCAICGWVRTSGLDHHSYHRGYLAGRGSK